MRVGVIGAGLGGLLTGAALLKGGHDVEVFEKLSYPGGRFTNLEYKGYQLSTGALHMIPHGTGGPLSEMLHSLNTDVDIIASEPIGLFRVAGEDYTFTEVSELLPAKEKLRLGAVLALMKVSSGDGRNFEEWLRGKIHHPLVYQVVDSFGIWMLSLRARQVPSREYIAIGKAIVRHGGPGVPSGGCKGVTDALVEVIEGKGGIISYKSKVDGIMGKDGAVKGIKVRGRGREFDVVISDIGPRATARLLGDGNNHRFEHVAEVAGIKISVACDRPMLGHTGVLFTPQAQRIGGLNEVTNADPDLAPEGKHLLMSHQAWDPSRDVREETRIGVKDLHTIFPDFDDHCEVLMVQSYKGEWPVNRAPSGTHLECTGPIKGLFYVGDAVKPEGFMETEGIAAGVGEVLKKIEGL
ncbi:MAG: phytoene desaturase family protein [Candidatus Hydrothermarchaeaceae archaeon]